ncbi:hypothetical protein V0242_25595 (plasmid) [Aeromonas hydrophila]|uniref:hypothetical protein n=1 Tax=Aeromonas hydrophila TaxID=644 RepID=UPI002ED0D4E2|nr:hypothetical protein V0242_25595 [Aeromonas hydrophila]
MGKALDVANEVLVEVSTLLPDELVKACGFDSVKDMMIDAITNKTPTGKSFVQMFIDRLGSVEAALDALTEAN